MIEYVIAIVFMGIFTYYDVFNNRTIPDWVSYSFVVLSVLTFLIFMNFEIVKVGIFTLIFLIGYVLYKLGYLGGADVFAISGLSLLLPLNLIGIPTIIVLLLGSMLLTMVFVVIRFFIKNKKVKYEKNDALTSLLWLVGYGALAFMIYNMGEMLIGVTLFILGLINSLFALIKSNLMESMIEVIPLNKITEEDVLAIEKMDKKFVEENKIEKLLTKNQINKLEKLGVEEVPVYTGLPPYLPFVSIVTIIIIALLLL